MVERMRRQIGLFRYFFLFTALASKASHIVGGEITVKWIVANDFEVMAIYYSDCASGSIAFAPSVSVGIFDAVTNVMQSNVIINISSSPAKLVFGDSCAIVGKCVEMGVYKKTVTIPDNPGGYYLSCQLNSRNTSILNILSVPSPSTGITLYADIPDPSKHNSSPVFNTVPNAYMCVNETNTISLSCTDPDGDDLVYYLERPFDSNDKAILYPAAQPKPYTPISWISVSGKPYYNSTNMIGGSPAMTIDPNTGIITANPDMLGLFVFVVRVEEKDKITKIKKGEIRRDMRYEMINCFATEAAVFTQPLADSYNVCAGDSLCINVRLEDPSPADVVTFSASSELIDSLINEPRVKFSSPKGIKTVDTTFCIYPGFNDIRNAPYHVVFNGQDSSCYGVHKVSKAIDLYVCPELFYAPSAFSPNGDGLNEEFFANTAFVKTFEFFIFDRWGNIIFQTTDVNEKWNGKIKYEKNTITKTFGLQAEKEAMEDVYIYLAHITDVFDMKHNYKGIVTLVK